ncbi:hypothetical protein PISL3812_07182 [Talaromyces islandicus]|uniref:Uncharacterized protein n=1 Tax=Talaromyces islandicus TaxID=28573 RepID=A0A0U1M535_TALIS|nr:hypothetical protein PISL3812_07182 [Talaromyces islandicus]
MPPTVTVLKRKFSKLEPPTVSSNRGDSSDSFECLISTSIPTSAPDTISMACQELQNAAQHEPLQEEPLFTDKTLLTNSRGGYWAGMERWHGRDMEMKTAQLDAKTARLDATSARLVTRTDDHERTSVGFRNFRHRFISTYKRDVLHEEDDSDRRFTQYGNHVVHRGNVKRDCELYSGLNQRSDPLVFQKLYGVLPVLAASMTTTLQSRFLMSTLQLFQTSNVSPLHFFMLASKTLSLR